MAAKNLLHDEKTNVKNTSAQQMYICSMNAENITLIYYND